MKLPTREKKSKQNDIRDSCKYVFICDFSSDIMDLLHCYDFRDNWKYFLRLEKKSHFSLKINSSGNICSKNNKLIKLNKPDPDNLKFVSGVQGSLLMRN